VKMATKLPARRAGASARPARSGKVPGRIDEVALLGDLRTLVQAARQRVATAANATYTQLCWQVGRRLLAENLQVGRAAYGKQTLATVSQELTAEFGPGYSYTALTRMARFAEWMTHNATSPANKRTQCVQRIENGSSTSRSSYSSVSACPQCGQRNVSTGWSTNAHAVSGMNFTSIAETRSSLCAVALATATTHRLCTIHPQRAVDNARNRRRSPKGPGPLRHVL
jgi:DUF1016 N-terminal domain